MVLSQNTYRLYRKGEGNEEQHVMHYKKGDGHRDAIKALR